MGTPSPSTNAAGNTASKAEFRLNLRMFGVEPVDPGFVYVIEDRGRFKIGRSADGKARLRAARTWLPHMKIVGMKPFWNHQHVEQSMHIGFAACWDAGEWFELLDDGYRDVLVEGFSEFSDTDRDRNSVDFIYWVNGSGMSELTMEHSQRGVSRRRFLLEVSGKGT